MIKTKTVQMITVQDWDKLVEDTYGKIYSFQQQDGCQSRGTVEITIPSEETLDEEMHDEIPEIVNGEIMGVKFEKWLARDPEQLLSDPNNQEGYSLRLWWYRNFYPDIQMVANDLHKRGLIEAGEYTIKIDW